MEHARVERIQFDHRWGYKGRTLAFGGASGWGGAFLVDPGAGCGARARSCAVCGLLSSGARAPKRQLLPGVLALHHKPTVHGQLVGEVLRSSGGDPFLHGAALSRALTAHREGLSAADRHSLDGELYAAYCDVPPSLPACDHLPFFAVPARAVPLPVADVAGWAVATHARDGASVRRAEGLDYYGLFVVASSDGVLADAVPRVGAAIRATGLTYSLLVYPDLARGGAERVLVVPRARQTTGEDIGGLELLTGILSVDLQRHPRICPEMRKRMFRASSCSEEDILVVERSLRRRLGATTAGRAVVAVRRAAPGSFGPELRPASDSVGWASESRKP